ncbi:MAG: hypothetical protein ACLS9I_10100, partial [Adlercreutzia equolifaciens]
MIVYGLSQMNLIGGSLKIYANGVHAGTVKKHGVLEFSIRENSIITAKCGKILLCRMWVAHPPPRALP